VGRGGRPSAFRPSRVRAGGFRRNHRDYAPAPNPARTDTSTLEVSVRRCPGSRAPPAPGRVGGGWDSHLLSWVRATVPLLRPSVQEANACPSVKAGADAGGRHGVPRGSRRGRGWASRWAGHGPLGKGVGREGEASRRGVGRSRRAGSGGREVDGLGSENDRNSPQNDRQSGANDHETGLLDMMTRVFERITRVRGR
jgi:hypothetical protein